MRLDWVKWHTHELAAVTVPTVGAVTVHPLLWTVTAVTVIRWGMAEWKHRPAPWPACPSDAVRVPEHANLTA